MRTLWQLVRATGQAWVDDRAQTMGAALAYYALFSIAPLVLIAISMAGFFFGRATAQDELMGQLAVFVGPTGANAVDFLLRSVSQTEQSIAAMVFGGVLILVGSTSVLSELQADLDFIWRMPGPPRQSGVIDWIRRRLLALLMVIALGALLTALLLASTALSVVQRWWSPLLDEWARLASVADIGASLVVTMIGFALLFRVLPSARLPWHEIGVGAAVTAVLFTIGKIAIGLYIGHTSISSAYGAASSLVVLLVWIYYSAQIFLLGAEFTWVYAHRRSAPRIERA